jgi:peptidoglycan/xylan/chitin deacetylase (PgdA/CDA1 family)
MKNAGRLLVSLTALGALGATPATDAPPPRTVVSIIFDDSRDSQPLAIPILAEFGMQASFFIISGTVGTPGYMTWEQIAAIRAAGHEIGGHTIDHVALPGLSTKEAQHQVCDERTVLEAHGLGPLVSFAYPKGTTDPEKQAVLAGCGYRYGIAQGGLDHENCKQACQFAETLPPANPLALESPLSVTKDWTLADLQGWVTRAEEQGGWLGLTFHMLCDGCNYNYTITPAVFHDFLAWLSAREARGTVVLPVGEAFLPPKDPVTPATPALRPVPQPGGGQEASGGGPDAGGCSTGGSSSRTAPAGFAALLLALGSRQGQARRR